jgi:hypothetical protein
VSGEHQEGRAAMERVIERIRVNQEEAGKPFDAKAARREAQGAAIRTDQRANGIRKSPKPKK